jgi:hypothetical protein
MINLPEGVLGLTGRTNDQSPGKVKAGRDRTADPARFSARDCALREKHPRQGRAPCDGLAPGDWFL